MGQTTVSAIIYINAINNGNLSNSKFFGVWLSLRLRYYL